MLRLLVLLVSLLGCLSATAPSLADDEVLPVAQIVQLSAEQLELEVRRKLAQKPVVELLRPLEQAQLALARLAEARDKREDEAVARNLELARAAFALSETRRVLLRERALLAASLRRKEGTLARIAQSKALSEKAKARLAQIAADAGAAP